MKAVFAAVLFSLLGFSQAAFADQLVEKHTAQFMSDSIVFTAQVNRYTYRDSSHYELDVSYYNTYGNTICGDTSIGRSPVSSLDLVFTVGTEKIHVPASIDCYATVRSPRARVRISSLSQKELFDRIFPVTTTGDRWFALKLSVFTSGYQWLDNYGQGFNLILKPQPL